ncbi:uncharacterized protein L969DRAFT_97433 [Mixia osmundae IAM 14324]|uniref:F-box domain-containing protein n=1 Tax=Mixia osmundae (strain CBS 9802 / IAM 14324 / JCM 22182 / KY 12970) TaxID=764103 RepID=G7E4J3_MIXOS|nr:uncharacterized protein L969DRAFT_97433 [Mixia osmundae IAM 14324]KEI36230.1 hypothetical protein L969DRAFT_97433 [Mixia osmundae IAM 14324]GAA97753.1 hypothetical protein E5Q_04432 [Mixia osmundae IAM 14324]
MVLLREPAFYDHASSSHAKRDQLTITSLASTSTARPVIINNPHVLIPASTADEARPAKLSREDSFHSCQSEMDEPASSIMSLPVETLSKIAIMSGRDDIGSLFGLSSVNRLFRHLMESDYIWCMATSTPINDDLVASGRIARATAKDKYLHVCFRCNEHDPKAISILISLATPNSRRVPFCRSCHELAVRPRYEKKSFSNFAAAYWAWRAAQRAKGVRYTQNEIRTDAWVRQQALWRIGIFGITWDHLWNFDHYVTAELKAMCRVFVFHCGQTQVTIEQVSEALALFRKRYKPFNDWAKTHESAIKRVKGVRPDPIDVWQARATVADQRCHLNFQALGLHLAKPDCQLLSREFGVRAAKGVSAIQYRLGPIVLARHNEKAQLSTELDKVPQWIEEYVNEAEGPLNCIRLNCTHFATPGCKCCLCAIHCTPAERAYLRRPPTCAVHRAREKAAAKAARANARAPIASGSGLAPSRPAGIPQRP